MSVDINDGVVSYLDATAGLHNGHDGQEFEGYMPKLGQPQTGLIKVTISGLADLYGVHRHTMQDWVRRYNREHAQDHDDSHI